MKNIFFLLGLILIMTLNAQEFSFDEFVGTWNGNSYSENVPDWNAAMTLVVEEDGFYTDSSGILMPTIYPNTQQVEYSSTTNRVHFWYLSTVYSGNTFYTHYYFEVIYYDGVTLHMAYNFWDDPEPHPDTQLIILEKDGVMNEGTVEGYVKDFDAQFPIGDAAISMGDYYTVTDANGYFNLVVEAGIYDITVMKNGHYESVDNIEVIAEDNLLYLIDLQHMYNPPENLNYQINRASVSLQWNEPVGMNLSGFHIYRDSEVIGFTTDLNYLDSEVAEGIYSYSVTAIYGNYESSLSNQISVEILNPTDAENDYLSASTELIGNYPNPFNPATNIKFVMSESGHVKIDIYNSKGQKIITIVDEQKEAGNYSVVWNGKDDSGKNVPSGVYFSKMRSAKYTATRKMILMK
jgi:hypothetical protein